MEWAEIRAQYPHVWLVVEAVRARTEGTQRMIEQLEVVGVFGDNWQAAWEHYRQAHEANRQREFYVLHTDRAELNIGVLDTFGRKLAG